MDGVFLNMNRGTRLTAYLGLEMDEGHPMKFARDYCYAEIPVKEFYNPAADCKQEKAQRNQHIQIIPACKMQLRDKFRVLVKTNPILQEVSNCPAMFLLDIGDAGIPSFYATFRKDFDMRDLEWAIRIYMLA